MTRLGWFRLLLLAGLTVPLLSTTCLDMTTRVVISSFFDAFTPVADAQLRAYLGLSEATANTLP